MTDEEIADIREQLIDFVRRAADRGDLILSGWERFAGAVLPDDVTDDEYEGTKLSFVAGAEFMWSSVFKIIHDSDRPSADDIRRMQSIEQEIRAWREVLVRELCEWEGCA